MTPAGAATRHAASDGEAGPAANANPLSGRPDERLLGKRILIIEDEALLAFELQLVFEDEGAVVIGPAMSLLQALELVAHTAEIDAALLDVDLAGDDVYPIAELLLQRGVPFAFHTGHGSHTALTQLFPGMATLMKPMLPESLVEHLAGIAR